MANDRIPRSTATANSPRRRRASNKRRTFPATSFPTIHRAEKAPSCDNCLIILAMVGTICQASHSHLCTDRSTCNWYCSSCSTHTPWFLIPCARSDVAFPPFPSGYRRRLLSAANQCRGPRLPKVVDEACIYGYVRVSFRQRGCDRRRRRIPTLAAPRGRFGLRRSIRHHWKSCRCIVALRLRMHAVVATAARHAMTVRPVLKRSDVLCHVCLFLLAIMIHGEMRLCPL